jgi:hypothetical protein
MTVDSASNASTGMVTNTTAGPAAQKRASKRAILAHEIIGLAGVVALDYFFSRKLVQLSGGTLGLPEDWRYGVKLFGLLLGAGCFELTRHLLSGTIIPNASHAHASSDFLAIQHNKHLNVRNLIIFVSLMALTAVLFGNFKYFVNSRTLKWDARDYLRYEKRNDEVRANEAGEKMPEPSAKSDGNSSDSSFVSFEQPASAIVFIPKDVGDNVRRYLQNAYHTDDDKVGVLETLQSEPERVFGWQKTYWSTALQAVSRRLYLTFLGIMMLFSIALGGIYKRLEFEANNVFEILRDKLP